MSFYINFYYTLLIQEFKENKIDKKSQKLIKTQTFIKKKTFIFLTFIFVQYYFFLKKKTTKKTQTFSSFIF